MDVYGGYGVDYYTLNIGFKQLSLPLWAKQKESWVGEGKWYFGLDDFNDLLCMDACV